MKLPTHKYDDLCHTLVSVKDKLNFYVELSRATLKTLMRTPCVNVSFKINLCLKSSKIKCEEKSPVDE